MHDIIYNYKHIRYMSTYNLLYIFYKHFVDFFIFQEVGLLALLKNCILRFKLIYIVIETNLTLGVQNTTPKLSLSILSVHTVCMM